MTSATGAPVRPAAASSGEMTAILKSTEPWVRVVSGVAFVSALLTLIAMAFLFTGEGAAGSDADGVTGMTAFILGSSGVLQLLFWRACASLASALSKHVKAGDNTTLVEVMKQNRGFWQFLGGLYLILIVFGLVIAVATGVIGS